MNSSENTHSTTEKSRRVFARAVARELEPQEIDGASGGTISGDSFVLTDCRASVTLDCGDGGQID